MEISITLGSRAMLEPEPEPEPLGSSGFELELHATARTARTTDQWPFITSSSRHGRWRDCNRPATFQAAAALARSAIGLSPVRFCRQRTRCARILCFFE